MSNITVYDNRFSTLSHDYPEHTIVITPAYKITGMLWWKKRIEGWVAKQSHGAEWRWDSFVQVWDILIFSREKVEVDQFVKTLQDSEIMEGDKNV